MVVAAAQYASIDGTALHGVDENDAFSRPIVRRSLSIFSRRGTETPEPGSPFIVQAAMAPQKKMTQRQASWIKRKSVNLNRKDSVASPPTPRGTILNAVPPAKTIEMTPLEEEMATSPNEEIMSAVSGSPTSPALYSKALWNTSAVSLSQRAKAVRRKQRDTRIGIWVNGVAHWDDDVVEEGSKDGDLPAQTGFTPVLAPTPSPITPVYTKPSLSVVIPGKERVIPTVPTIAEPAPRRQTVCFLPASVISKLSSPNVSAVEPHVVSPLDSPEMRLVSPVERPKAPFQPASQDDRYIQPRDQLAASSSSSSLVANDDTSSTYSIRSSATSVEEATANANSEEAFIEPKSLLLPNLNKPLPTAPIPPPRRAAPAPPSAPVSVRPTHARSASFSSGLDTSRTSIFSLPKRTRTSTSLSQPDSIYQELESPTLSEAADDLEAHLSAITDSNPVSRQTSVHHGGMTFQEGPAGQHTSSIHRSNSVRNVMQPPEIAPALPRRSRKREWRILHGRSGTEQFTNTSVPRRRRSTANEMEPAQGVAATVRRTASVVTPAKPPLRSLGSPPASSSVTSLMLQAASEDSDKIVVERPDLDVDFQFSQALVSSGAEEVLLNILQSLDHVDDLMSTAMINKGMYRVYKDNEMMLLRTALHNQSPAAWEFNEWCLPGDETPIDQEFDAKSYIQIYRRSMHILQALKGEILQNCYSVVRRETAAALALSAHRNGQRVDDALWRISCFCKVFGSGKGREEDVTGQLDWLKGGILANNVDLTSTMNMNLDYELASVLLNPPEYFAKGNVNGLTAAQLYDMTEIWSCLTTILQSYHGHTSEAREFGVFDECEINDEEDEHRMLEEWTAYLLTLGPAVVLEMARHDPLRSSAGFAIARANGWTRWTAPQYGDSRTTFLKEPVSRLYEERVAAAAHKLQNPRETEMKELSRKRVAHMAAEIKLARRASSYKRRPVIDMETEQSMSPLSRNSSTASMCPPRTSSIKALERRSSTLHPPRPKNFSVPRPHSPPSSLWAPHKIHPIIEERVETFNRISLQNFAGGVAEDTSDLAVKRIVDMGFNANEAREALRMTDMGDGLRVDRAVDLLLRRQQ